MQHVGCERQVGAQSTREGGLLPGYLRQDPQRDVIVRHACINGS